MQGLRQTPTVTAKGSKQALPQHAKEVDLMHDKDTSGNQHQHCFKLKRKQ
jgi:hypothetical protein